MPERSFDDFDEFAANYRSIHTANIELSGADSFYFAKMKVQLLQGLEHNEDLRVLDVGCGDGSTEVFMKQFFPSWKIDGIDVSEKSITASKSKEIPAVTFQWYDGTHMPFDNEVFDLVFMAGVLHHIDFSLHRQLIAEIYRVTKKGGRFYLFEHNPLNPVTRHLVKTCVFDRSAKLLKHGYTSRLLRSGNFKVVRKWFIIFFPRKRIFAAFIFLEKYLRKIPLGGQYFIVYANDTTTQY
jgi:Methylase involved in ubiquinone/menaquinone biosynthesis